MILVYFRCLIYFPYFFRGISRHVITNELVCEFEFQSGYYVNIRTNIHVET